MSVGFWYLRLICIFVAFLSEWNNHWQNYTRIFVMCFCQRRHHRRQAALLCSHSDLIRFNNFFVAWQLVDIAHIYVVQYVRRTQSFRCSLFLSITHTLRSLMHTEPIIQKRRAWESENLICVHKTHIHRRRKYTAFALIFSHWRWIAFVKRKI